MTPGRECYGITLRIDDNILGINPSVDKVPKSISTTRLKTTPNQALTKRDPNQT